VVIGQKRLIKSKVLRESAYREAVMDHSPGLPRFAATLGTESGNDRNPNGVVTLLGQTVCLVEKLEVYIDYRLEALFVLWLIRALPLIMRAIRRNPVGVEGSHVDGFPRVAAKRGNPGLCLRNRFAVLLPGQLTTSQ